MMLDIHRGQMMVQLCATTAAVAQLVPLSAHGWDFYFTSCIPISARSLVNSKYILPSVLMQLCTSFRFIKALGKKTLVTEQTLYMAMSTIKIEF